MNLAAWLLECGRADDVCLIEPSRRIRYGELAARVGRIAASVRRDTADREAPIVPLLGEPSIDWVSAYLGILYAGAVPAPLGPLSLAAFAGVMQQTDSALALAVDGVPLVGSPRVKVVEACLDAGTLPSPALTDPRAMALLLHTSGSTSAPRGVMLSADNLVSNARAIVASCPLASDERAFVTLPFYYCYGLSVLHTHLRAGASLVFPKSSFLSDLVEGLETSAATGMPAVPSLLATLVARSCLDATRLPHVRYVMASGGRLGKESIRGLRTALPHATLFVRYGVTELTAAASFLPPERLDDKLGSIGTGLVGAPLCVERGDGTLVTPGSGEVGEIVGRGPHVALGYFGAGPPGSTAGTDATAFDRGVFHTGDAATVDDEGFVTLVAREKEFVKTAGHRVAPQEVEEVLAGASGVVEAAVCGVDHGSRGEALVAFVVVDPAAQPAPEALRRHCLDHLAPHKVPVAIRVVTELPKTPNGKLARRELPALLSAK
jgi:acyl-CoA synthetase (AMP-forming)/AMP-acid ligase II